MKIKLLMKNNNKKNLFVSSFIFVYFALTSVILASDNFIVTTVNKIPISKVDIINKSKILSYSIDKNFNSDNLSKFYDQALNNLISEKIILSEGLKNNKNIENLVEKQANKLLLEEFDNSEINLSQFLKKLSIPKSILIDKYKTQLILGYIIKNKYKSQLANLEISIEKKINTQKKQRMEDLFELAEIVINKKNNSKLFDDIQLALKSGANFLDIAKQVSISSSSEFNGKLGWKTNEEMLKIIKIKKDTFSEGDIFSYSNQDKIFIYKILAIRINGNLSKKEDKALIVEAKFPIDFRNKEQAYFDVRKELEILLNNENKCDKLNKLNKSNKLKINLSIIKSRIADISPVIGNSIQDLEFYAVSKPIFSGNNGYVYIICDMQKATNEEFNPELIKSQIMNKHFLNLSNVLLKRLNNEAKIINIQKIK